MGEAERGIVEPLKLREEKCEDRANSGAKCHEQAAAKRTGDGAKESSPKGELSVQRISAYCAIKSFFPFLNCVLKN